MGKAFMSPKTIDEMIVLIIDDDRHMRMLIRNVLFALGVKDVIEASDGTTALEEMKSLHPDMILCDLKMEPMGGMDFVKQLRLDQENPDRHDQNQRVVGQFSPTEVKLGERILPEMSNRRNPPYPPGGKVRSGDIVLRKPDYHSIEFYQTTARVTREV